MSDVRDELMEQMRRWCESRGITPHAIWIERCVSATLEGFDLAPKPVISDEELGRMVAFAHLGVWPPISGSTVGRGGRLRDALDSFGFQIVRKEAGE